jgi:hypothetical protein
MELTDLSPGFVQMRIRIRDVVDFEAVRASKINSNQ